MSGVKKTSTTTTDPSPETPADTPDDVVGDGGGGGGGGAGSSITDEELALARNRTADRKKKTRGRVTRGARLGTILDRQLSRTVG
jgi:hypothetical protein